MKDLVPAATVIGVDVCVAAIEYAAAHYSKPGLDFRRCCRLAGDH